VNAAGVSKQIPLPRRLLSEQSVTDHGDYDVGDGRRSVVRLPAQHQRCGLSDPPTFALDVTLDDERQPRRPISGSARLSIEPAVGDARGGFVSNRIFFDTAAALDPAAHAARARNYTRPMTRPGELAQAWRTAGFDDVTETTLAIRMTFASFADYWAPYEGQEGPAAQYVGTLDAPARMRLRGAVEAAYLDGEDDGPRSYAALAWAVKGRVPG